MRDRWCAIGASTKKPGLSSRVFLFARAAHLSRRASRGGRALRHVTPPACALTPARLRAARRRTRAPRRSRACA
ncbi:hypothetical protein F4W02_36385 [Burkholderia pseudomallei]|nr:hypothetical protein [Burkholderia pseudomallei]